MKKNVKKPYPYLAGIDMVFWHKIYPDQLESILYHTNMSILASLVNFELIEMTKQQKTISIP